MPRPTITFLSDLGTDDWFVGGVHGVLPERAPDAVAHALTERRHFREPVGRRFHGRGEAAGASGEESRFRAAGSGLRSRGARTGIPILPECPCASAIAAS